MRPHVTLIFAGTQGYTFTVWAMGRMRVHFYTGRLRAVRKFAPVLKQSKNKITDRATPGWCFSEIRSRLLTLLIKFGAPSFDPNALTDTAEPSPQKRTKNRGVQVDPPSPVAVPVTSQAQSSPNKAKDRSQGTEVWTGDCSSQMDDSVIGRGASRAYQDAAVQTEVVCELSLLQQTGASGLAGTERVDSSTVTGWWRTCWLPQRSCTSAALGLLPCLSACFWSFSLCPF